MYCEGQGLGICGFQGLGTCGFMHTKRIHTIFSWRGGGVVSQIPVCKFIYFN